MEELVANCLNCSALAPPTVAAIVGALVGLTGAYLIQARIERQRKLDQFRSDLRRFIDLAATFWTSPEDEDPKGISRVRIRNQKALISTTLESWKDRQFQKAYKASRYDWEELWETVTSIPFESDTWESDEGRASKVALLASKIQYNLPSY